MDIPEREISPFDDRGACAICRFRSCLSNRIPSGARRDVFRAGSKGGLGGPPPSPLPTFGLDVRLFALCEGAAVGAPTEAETRGGSPRYQARLASRPIMGRGERRQ